MANNDKITNTCILTLYRRPEYLEEQVDAILRQTILPDEIWFWKNQHKDMPLWADAIYNSFNKIKEATGKLPTIFGCSKNLKYHPRFAVALLANTDFVSIFDDDSIPGRKWFENCMNSYQKKNGIYGTAGVSLNSHHYVDHERVGWPSQNKEIQEVDLVGHAWFFPQFVLPLMWLDRKGTLENGEDIQLSAQAKIHGEIKTYCPPHPADDMEMWGSLKPWEYGNDKKASSNGSLMSIPQFYAERDECIQEYLLEGWETVKGVKIDRSQAI